MMTKAVARILAALALATVLQPHATVMLADAGSDFTRCVMACNETRKICLDRCKVDCTEMFPGSDNEVQRDNCVAACTAECAAISEQCKLGCKEDPSPNEP